MGVGEVLVQLMTSFVASAGFSVLFNTPRRFLIACGVSGMIGWIVYYILTTRHIDTVPSSLVAAFFVAVLSHVFSRLHKAPIIIFTAAGIIPLVPGGLAYDATISFMNNNYSPAIQSAAKVFLISGAIGLGLMIAEVLYRALQKTRVI